MTDKLKIHLHLEEAEYDLNVPVQIEIEYQLEGNRVSSSSISKKIRYNLPLLIKEAPSRSVKELERLVDQAVRNAIDHHFSSRGYTLEGK